MKVITTTILTLILELSLGITRSVNAAEICSVSVEHSPILHLPNATGNNYSGAMAEFTIIPTCIGNLEIRSAVPRWNRIVYHLLVNKDSVDTITPRGIVCSPCHCSRSSDDSFTITDTNVNQRCRIRLTTFYTAHTSRPYTPGVYTSEMLIGYISQ